MKKIRKNVFETNSSSTHALTLNNMMEENYAPRGEKFTIRFIDTDDEVILTTLKDKVSYLVSHIINYYKWDVTSYDDLKELVEKDNDFKHLEEFVLKKFNKQIMLPKSYSGSIEDIVNINHQLYDSCFDEVLRDLCFDNTDYLLDNILANGNFIEIGRD